MTGHKPGKNNIIRASIFLLIFLVLAVWRLYGAGFIIGSDDMDYPYHANQILNGTYQGGPYPSSNRLILLFATAASFTLFGIKPAALGIMPVLCSLASIFIIYFSLKAALGQKAAFGTALLWAMFPANIIHATITRPETPQALMIFVLIIYFYKAQTEKEHFNRNLLVAGIALALAYLIRESALAFILLLLIMQAATMIKRKRIVTEYFLFWIVPALTFIGECLFFKNLTGNYLFRLFGVEQGLNLGPFSGEIYQGWLILRRLIFDFIYRFATVWQLYGAIMIVILIPVIFYLKFPDKKIDFFKWWYIGSFLIYNFITTSLNRYLLLPADAKYLTALAPAGIIVLGYFIANFKEYSDDNKKSSFIVRLLVVFGVLAWLTVLKTGSIWGIILGLFLIFMAIAVRFPRTRKIGIMAALLMLIVPAILAQPALKHNRELPWRKPMVRYLGEKPDHVYADPRTVRILRFLYGYDFNDKILEFPEGQPESGVFIVNHPFLEMDFDYYGYVAPAYVYDMEKSIAPDWLYDSEILAVKINENGPP